MSTRKVTKSNILLASLLATRASAEQPVVNTLSIGSIATVTPQISLLKQRGAPADQLATSLVADAATSAAGGSGGAMRRFSNSSVSSVTSIATAADDTGVVTALTFSITPHVWLRGCVRFLPGWRKRHLNQAFSYVQLSHFDLPKINSARDFGQVWTLIANISGTDRDIDKRKTTLSTTIPPAFDERGLVL